MKAQLNFPEVLIFKKNCLHIIDQNALPGRVVYRRLCSAAEVAIAIKNLQVRGAPWIGVAAGYGLALEALRLSDRDLVPGLRRAARVLTTARPTAVNLFGAVQLIMNQVKNTSLRPRELRRLVISEAIAIEKEERDRSLAIARNGASLVPQNGRVLTICNTGILAGPGLGTALGVVYQAYLEGKEPMVFVCETRPLLQGARLTTWELKRAGIKFTLLADSASASLIEQCDLVIVGADRIAANGDTANKIGTRMLAILAKEAAKPFYVAVPSSTFDLTKKTGREIPIEQRASKEVTWCAGCRTAPVGCVVYNPAFDITPSRYITGFITESGIVVKPYKRNILRFIYSVVTSTRSIKTGGRL